MIRATTEDKVIFIHFELHMPTTKKVQIDFDLLNMIENLHEFDGTTIIYTNMIHHLQESGLDFQLPDSKTTPK